MVCIQRPYYHFGVQRHIYISILEIPAHIYIYICIYIIIYICMQVGIKWFAHTNLITIYIYITFDS